MTITIILIAAGILTGLAAGFGLTKILQAKEAKIKGKELEEKTRLLVKEAEIQAERIKNERILEAKEKYIKLRAEFEDEVNKRKQAISQGENRIKQREQHLTRLQEDQGRKETELDGLKKNLGVQLESINKRKEE